MLPGSEGSLGTGHARAIAFAGGDPGRVIVVSIPDWSVTEFASGRDRAQIVREVDAYNAAKREIARELGARWVDVTPTSRELPDAVVGDGLHPSCAQYREWAEADLETWGWYGVVDHVARFTTTAGDIGYGLHEHGFFGPFPKYGLQRWDDGAP